MKRECGVLLAISSLPKGTDPLKVTMEECLKVIAEADSKPTLNAVIAEYTDSDIQVLNGRYGPYIKHAGSNYKIPKGTNAASLTEEDCKKIISNSEPTSKKPFRRSINKK